MSPLVWSSLLSALGCVLFWLAGRKVWWCWYLGLGLQALWAVYGALSAQWGFLLGTAFYGWIYALNAYKWTMEHRYPPMWITTARTSEPPEDFKHWSEAQRTIASLVAAAGGRIEVPYDVLCKDWTITRTDGVDLSQTVVFTVEEEART